MRGGWCSRKRDAGLGGKKKGKEIFRAKEEIRLRN